MIHFPKVLAASALLLLASCTSSDADGERASTADLLRLPGESHLANIRQLTFGGQNAEAYWSYDDSELIFQSTRDELECDQIFRIDVESGETSRVSPGGWTTCAFFLPQSERVIWASTHGASHACPPKPDRSRGYVWPLHADADIWISDRNGDNAAQLTNTPGYDAEATVSRDGTIVFTSIRSGDLELWTMQPDGSDLRQITGGLGYDGGAFFSNDGSKIVWRRTRFDSAEEKEEYRALLAQGLVRPSKMEIWVSDADGSNARALTDNGKANFGPFFTPDDKSVVFASNIGSESGRIFDIWMVSLDGGEPERITHNDESFDGFPMFSWDGSKLAFASNRNGSEHGETNVFVADWIP
ncbi:MAG: hypothetical protein DHS20C15_33120 [Planctomycetota bacterium]|nr:MAG: hypothetical protein DHS20C15_33120 [Planctomycetota bacterium]